MPPMLRVFDTPDALAAAAADLLFERIRGGARQIGLAGGTTPQGAYRLLAQKPVPWAQVDFFFGDERCVSPLDPLSNFHMARHALPDARLHRMLGEAAGREDAAREYEAELPQPLDLLLLGVGEDGHTASLFAGMASLTERTRRVVPTASPKPPPWRLTVTPPVLEEARALLVLAAGAPKASAVASALQGDNVPAAFAARAGATWMLDRAAAARVKP